MLKAVFSFSLMTFFSRITGFIRDMFIARYFGVSVGTDAFFVAFRIPNLFRRIFAEGAFNLSFMPILAEARNQNKTIEIDFIARALGILTTFVMLLSLIGSVFAPLFILILAPGLDTATNAQSGELLRIMFPYIALISLSSFFQAILHTYHRFALGAITPIFLNLALIASMFFLIEYLDEPIHALAIGVLIGGVLQFIWPFYFAHRLKIITKPKVGHNELTRKTMKNMAPIIFSSSVSQINILIDTALASLLISGSISWLYYSNRLLELPIGMLGVALSTVGISYFSKYYQTNQIKALNHSVHQSLSLALVSGIACFIGLLVFAEPIMVSLFQYGNFTLFDAKMSAYALKAYALSVLMILLIKILSSVFFAMGDTRTPSKIAFMTVGVNLVFNLSLMYFFAHIGLAMASSISTSFQALMLFLALKKNNQIELNTSVYLKQIASSLLIGVVLAAIAIFSLNVFGVSLEAEDWLKLTIYERMGWLGGIILFFGAFYLGLIQFFVFRIFQFKSQ